jgi:DNA-directed RNA polymerase subunit RPC12/RpoP
MQSFSKIKEGAHFTQKTFPCTQCGANLVFCADDDALKCKYCGVVTQVTPPPLPIDEYDFHDALGKIRSANWSLQDQDKEIKCPSCAANFSINFHTRSTTCPYCNSPIVTNMDIFMPLSPKSLLPFDVNQKEARKILQKWVGNLWFAPSSLKQFTETDSKFLGIYLPYWTYDSNTESRYYGQRGIIYHDRVTRRVYIDGREQLVEDVVERIEWTSVSGQVRNHFDDVLIGATHTIPRKLADSLEPWDLENLTPFDDRYLSGFESETYQVALDEGFNYAQEIMEYYIREDVRYQIGGDRQQITDLKIYHDNTTFKYILLPIWTAHFKHNNKEYRFAINARTGVIKGERPYSKLKIILAVLAVLAILGTFFAAAEFDNRYPDSLQHRFDNIHIEIRHF